MKLNPVVWSWFQQILSYSNKYLLIWRFLTAALFLNPFRYGAVYLSNTEIAAAAIKCLYKKKLSFFA